ncbi:inositol monophosphatase family protein [Dactylosporangium sp. CA-092794]|uniref:inositol monophosphatase family protein n=1 Tax=Dactylosporangium sp. CA-092794 TaxID=3239929 RepID=UPI003D8EBBAE
MHYTTTELQDLLVIARQVVGDAEQLLSDGRPAQVHAKGVRDMVSDVELAVEQRIRDALRAATPHIGFLGEELGGDADDTATRWILHPVDGTANFIRNLPLCGISLALVDGLTPRIGVIHLQYLGRRYWAASGLGAWRDGTPIRPSAVTDLSQAMVTIGDAGAGAHADERNRVSLRLHAHLADHAQRVRLLGSSAVDLAFVADGTVDASITFGNRAWDMAAGAVIAREAGAAVMDIDGSDHTTASRATIATAPGLRDAILAVLAAATAGSRYTPDQVRSGR